MSDTPTKILLLGGGFGGLYTAIELEKQLRHHSNVEITLVNRENFFSFTPMLHGVAASDLDVTHIVNPVRKMLTRTTSSSATPNMSISRGNRLRSGTARTSTATRCRMITW